MPELSAEEVPLQRVFSSEYNFSIPAYQRPYAWQQEQALDLVNDLDEARRSNPHDPYFLGSIVLVKSKDRPEAEVVDGQQRLTTLTLLLAILRDMSEDEDHGRDLDEMIRQRRQAVKGLAERVRLTPRPKDADFFAKHVQEPGSTATLAGLKPDELETDAQRAVQANARALRHRLEELSEQERFALAEFLAQRAFLVAVRTEDFDSAHRIFGVMNARGLDLSPTDIFKSKVIGAIKDAGGDDSSYSDTWEDVEEALGRDDFADLFLHIRLIESKQRGRHSLLREFPEQVLNEYLPSDGPRFIDELLVPSAKAYEQIRDANYSASSGADRVNKWFARLSQLDNNDWRAPALWAMRTHGTDPEWLDRFFKKLERLAASMFIRRVWTTPRVTRYVELLRQLDDDGADLEAAAFELTAEEQADTISLLDGDVYLSPKTRKYVLLRLDEVMAGQAGVRYDHPIITVEHVLPQSPAEHSEWRNWFTDDERETWTHRLANLVLLNQVKNSEAQNYEFEVKKRKYFSGASGSTPFALTSQVLSHTSWDADVLKQRQGELLALLMREWSLSTGD